MKTLLYLIVLVNCIMLDVGKSLNGLTIEALDRYNDVTLCIDFRTLNRSSEVENTGG